MTIYQCEIKGVVKLLQAYMDADVSFDYILITQSLKLFYCRGQATAMNFFHEIFQDVNIYLMYLLKY